MSGCTVHICGGPDAINQKVHLPGRKHPVWFEFSWRFGPVLVDLHGDPKAKQPSEDDPFWPAFEVWLAEFSKSRPSPATTTTGD